MAFYRENDNRGSTAEERMAMSVWRFGHKTEAETIELIGADRFRELLTPREKAARATRK